MPENRESFQVCMNLNRVEVLLPFSNVELENACMIVNNFTSKIILPEDLQYQTQTGRGKFDCRDGSILVLHENGHQKYFCSFIPYGILEP